MASSNQLAPQCIHLTYFSHLQALTYIFTEFGEIMILFGNLGRFRSVICGIKKRYIYWLTQIDKKQEFGLINNINVREAIVRPKGDKNLIQQYLRVQQHSTRSRTFTKRQLFLSRHTA